MNPLWLVILVPAGAVAGRWLLLTLAGRAFAATAHRKARREQAALANFPHQPDRRAT